jgi:signal peptidase I
MPDLLARLRGKSDNSKTPAEPQPQPPQAWPGSFSDWTWTAVLFLFLTTTLVQGFEIPTGSMEGSLLIGDRLLVNKQTYAASDPLSRLLLPYREPQRGDIIVFRFPLDINQAYVKRVVGVPGDRLRLEDRQLYINGQPVDEPYLSKRLAGSDPYRDNFPNYSDTAGTLLARRALLMHELHVQGGELVVPEGNYFAMGDNRDNSLDSRYWGFVPRENIIGKPLIVYWSYGYPYSDSYSGAIASKQVRWGRMLRVIPSFPTGASSSVSALPRQNTSLAEVLP